MNKKIFISMASYLDTMLFFTLLQAFSKAKNSHLLRVAVVNQHHIDHRQAIKNLPFANQIRYLHVQPQDTLGVSWARHLAFSLYDGEQYFLQIDSHTCFEQDWDVNLCNQHDSLLLRSNKPIISTYPYRFDMVDGVPKYEPSEGKTALILRPHKETSLTEDNVVLRFEGKHMFTDKSMPGCHIAAGFIFCSGNFIEEVPYDPFLYFHGEEQSLAARSYTKGWDIFHPIHTPLYHLYKMPDKHHDEHHWYGSVNSERAFSSEFLTERAKKRLFQLFCGDGLLGAYSLGKDRSLEEFIEFSGLDYKNKVINDRYENLLV